MSAPLKFSFMLSADAQAGDQVDDIRDQIEALGHEFVVTRSRFLPPPWFNLFVEGTSETTNNVALIGEMAEAGYQFIVLLTELPTLVNDEGLIWNYHTSDSGWTGRSEAFVALAPHMVAAWCYAPDSARLVRQFVRRSADIDMAWGKRFDGERKAVWPDFDFCFFGGLTKRRERVLQEIQRRGHSIDVIPHSSTLAERDARIPHSRVVLDIKQHHWWDLVSSVRYVTALQHGRPVVAEARSIKAQRRWEEIVQFALPGRFADEASRVLQNWQISYVDQLAALRRKPSLMSRAIGILPKPLEKLTRILLPAPAPAPVAPQPPSISSLMASASKIVTVPRPPDAPPVLIGTLLGRNIVQWKDRIYAIPQQVGRIELDSVDLRLFPMIKVYPDIARARLEILHEKR